jgi:2-desacetyl-2-hydroxyethyl bacteriochlorophyllide A dehydrogenase
VTELLSILLFTVGHASDANGAAEICVSTGAQLAGHKAWAEFVAVPRKNIHVLEEGFPLDCAAIIEPVACALRGVVQLKPHFDTPALIFGAGTMGMLLALLLDMRGVGPLTVVEMNQDRVRIARQLLPATIIHPDELGDLQTEIVIDATGNPRAIETAFQHVAPGGTVLIFGVASPSARVNFSPYDIYEREITVLGSKAILHTFSPAVDVVRRHASRFRPLIDRTSYSLERFNQALTALNSGSAVKIVLEPNS